MTSYNSVHLLRANDSNRTARSSESDSDNSLWLLRTEATRINGQIKIRKRRSYIVVSYLAFPIANLLRCLMDIPQVHLIESNNIAMSKNQHIFSKNKTKIKFSSKTIRIWSERVCMKHACDWWFYARLPFHWIMCIEAELRSVRRYYVHAHFSLSLDMLCRAYFVYVNNRPDAFQIVNLFTLFNLWRKHFNVINFFENLSRGILLLCCQNALRGVFVCIRE